MSADSQSLFPFIPPDTVSQVEAASECPYCSAYPPIPCALHRPKDGWQAWGFADARDPMGRFDDD